MNEIVIEEMDQGERELVRSGGNVDYRDSLE